MLPSLPSLAPRDSHNLWYSPAHTTNPLYPDPSSPSHDHLPLQTHNPQSTRNRTNLAATLSRHPLSRLSTDERYQHIRKSNIQNYGNAWLRPPGIPKSLLQLREEEREYKEHQESLRREQLAQELADAEAAAAEEAAMAMMNREEEEEGIEEEVEIDLDDDIPDGEEGLGGLDDDDDDDDDDEDDEDLEDGEDLLSVDDDEEASELTPTSDLAIESGRNRIVVQHLHAENLGLEDNESDSEDPEQMLQEEDLLHEHHQAFVGIGDGDTEMGGMGMDADLDGEVPEAEAEMGGYEHTDTEEECSSDEERSLEGERVPLRADTNFVSSMVRSDGTQNSMNVRRSGSGRVDSPRHRTPRRRG